MNDMDKENTGETEYKYFNEEFTRALVMYERYKFGYK